MYIVKYRKEDRNVVVKKMKGESKETKRRFQKEASILNSVKGHRNVSLEIRLSRACYVYTGLFCAPLRNLLGHNGEYNSATKRKMQEFQPNEGIVAFS